MSKYTLFGTTITFSDATDRYISWYLSIAPALQGASEDFKSFYRQSDNISDVLDGYAAALVSITKDWAIDPLFDTLLKLGIYDINRENFEDACWDLTGAEDYFEKVADAYNAIVEGLEDAKSYRAARKASRGRVVGGGFGLSGAIKGMATAGAINAVTGLGHSVVNGIGNIASSIAAASKKSSLYNDDKTLKTLTSGVRNCILDIFLAYHDFINECKDENWFDGSQIDTEKSDTLLENSFNVPKDKQKELLLRSFHYAPFNEDLLHHIFTHFEEEQESVFSIAKQYQVDLNNDLLKILTEHCSQDAEKICTIVKKYKPRFSAKEKESILEVFSDRASSAQEDYEAVLIDFSKIMEALGVKESESLADYEYDVLEGIAKDYDNQPFDKTAGTVDTIVACKVSDSTKAEYIYDSDIWELFRQYNVQIPDEEKLPLLYQKYQKLSQLGSLTNALLKTHLDALIDAIDFKDDAGQIPYAVREAMFECLSGILEAKTAAQKKVDDLHQDLSSGVINTVEDIISNSGIGFMTTSLTYRQSSLHEAAGRLTYCTLLEDEQPFIVYDERPLMHRGEYGFCFTDRRFVGKPEYGPRYEVPIEDIYRFERKGLLSSKFILYTKTSAREISAENLSELDKFTDCLNKILKVIPKNTAAITERKTATDKEFWQKAAKCLEQTPYLVEYFGMQEKADEILENSGIAAERRQLLDACENDAHLARCDLNTLEEYRNALQTLRMEESQRTALCNKLDTYAELLRTCKDQRTLELLASCEDSNLAQCSFDTVFQLKANVESHQFLSEEQKKDLLDKILPRANELTFLKKLSEAGDEYNRLLGVYAHLEHEHLSPELEENYRNMLREKILQAQRANLTKLTIGLESMSREAIVQALKEITCYDFDKSMLEAEQQRLEKHLDEIELKTLADFCDGLSTTTPQKITAFQEMVEKEGFKQKNISKYMGQINAQYWQLLYEDACQRCKQTEIAKLADSNSQLRKLRKDLESCENAGKDTAAHLLRLGQLQNIHDSYKEKRGAILQSCFDQLINFVDERVSQKLVPLTRTLYKPEVHIRDAKNLKKYAAHDPYTEQYARDEAPIFYVFLLNGSNAPIHRLTVTNYAIYLSDTRIALETVTELKPARIFGEISVVGVAKTASFNTELPYKARICLAETILEIARYAVRLIPQHKQSLAVCDNEYTVQLVECFANCPIPDDDKLVVDLPQPKPAAPAPKTATPAQSWVCKCGKTNAGNFCAACGSKKPAADNKWVCSCGSSNTGNFCPVCGKHR